MDNYTFEEIKNEITILKKSFYQVRLVDPNACQIMEPAKVNGKFTLIPSGVCYDTWFHSNQCINCTSSRALRTDQIQSKCETCNDRLFYITARPVRIKNHPLVLEIVQPTSYPDICPGNSEEDTLLSQFRSLNRKILLDSETSAYNREYLAEHLPNIFSEVREHHTVNAALIHLKSYDNIQEKYGPVAASGVICRLYRILQTTLSLSDCPDTILARYQNDTFFVLDKSHTYTQLCSCIRLIQKQSATQHILYQSQLLPFELESSTVSLNTEQICDSKQLFSLLQERLSSSDSPQ